MKFFILYLASSVGFLSSHAQELQFEASLTTAFYKAKQLHKPVFIEYYNADCPVCKKLEPFFSEPKIRAYYQENFICYRMNTENFPREDSLFIDRSGLYITSVPYFLFFDEAENFIHYSATKEDVDFLIAAAVMAGNKEERSGALAGKYLAGDRSIKTLYAYSNLLRLYKNDSNRTRIADELFQVFPKENLGTEKSFIITKNCVTSIDNGFFKYWFSHMDAFKAFEKIHSNAHNINTLGDIVQRSINSKERKDWDLIKIRQVKNMILKTGMSNDPDAFFWEQESEWLVRHNQIADAMKLFRSQVDKDSGNIIPTTYTLNYFTTRLPKGKNFDEIKRTLEQLNRQKASPEEKAALLYSQLLYYKKIGNRKAFSELSKTALSFYQANQLDTQQLTSLLSQ